MATNRKVQEIMQNTELMEKIGKEEYVSGVSELSDDQLMNVVGGVDPATLIVKYLGPIAYQGWDCMLKNMNWKTGEFSKCTCNNIITKWYHSLFIKKPMIK